MGIFLGCCQVVIKFWKTFNSLTEVDVDNTSTYQESTAAESRESLLKELSTSQPSSSYHLVADSKAAHYVMSLNACSG